jgi:hypothetical protein
VAQADPNTIVADLLSGQYRHSLRVVAFNTADGWARQSRPQVHALEQGQPHRGARLIAGRHGRSLRIIAY